MLVKKDLAAGYGARQITVKFIYLIVVTYTMNKLAKQLEMNYDPSIYSDITETGRLVELPIDDIEWISDKEEIQKIADKQVGKDLVFRSKYKFDTTDLGRILKIHTPLGANAYSDSTVDNVLTLKFYKL